MNNLSDFEMQRYRRQDMERIAAQSQQVADLRQNTQSTSQSTLFTSTMARLGDVMVKAGSHLQERYGELVEDMQQQSSETKRGQQSPQLS